jgi:CDP-glucose 4,6-dehydratase
MGGHFENCYRGRRVLVTGHTGFKGSWLALWLDQLGAEVAGYALNVPTQPANFEILGLKQRIRHYEADIRDQVSLARALDEFRPEVVFHLAAQSLVRASYEDPVLTFATNAMGMVSLLECVRARPWIRTAVLITSDKAYRNDEWCFGYRETDTLAGRDPYSCSKSCADLIAQSYFHSFLKGSPTSIATTRAGNVIGGGDWAEHRIVPDCMRAWSNGKSVAVRSPEATRPWQHVLEPLSGYLWLGARLLVGQLGLAGEAFNFGPDAGVDLSVAQLIGAMAARWPSVQWHVPEQPSPQAHEATLLKLSCDKVLHHLHWRPTLAVHETIELTVDWYRLWHEHSHEMRQFSQGQIERYCNLAHARGMLWAAGA